MANHLNHLKHLFVFTLCVWVFCLHECLCTPCGSNVLSRHQELELVTGGCQLLGVGAGNQTQVPLDWSMGMYVCVAFS